MFEVSERAHAGLQLMAALAANPDERQRLQSLAPDIGISPAYLEEIAAALRKANLIEGRQGPGGGYRLTRAPKTSPSSTSQPLSKARSPSSNAKAPPLIVHTSAPVAPNPSGNVSSTPSNTTSNP